MLMSFIDVLKAGYNIFVFPFFKCPKETKEQGKGKNEKETKKKEVLCICR